MKAADVLRIIDDTLTNISNSREAETIIPDENPEEEIPRLEFLDKNLLLSASNEVIGLYHTVQDLHTEFELFRSAHLPETPVGLRRDHSSEFSKTVAELFKQTQSRVENLSKILRSLGIIAS